MSPQRLRQYDYESQVGQPDTVRVRRGLPDLEIDESVVPSVVPSVGFEPTLDGF
jgi:hypothetical protein